jgi:hypothetical protein
MSDPNVTKAVAEAQSAFAWIKAQAASMWSQHKTATIVVVACAFLLGHCV